MGPFSSSVDLDQLKQVTNVRLQLWPRAPDHPAPGQHGPRGQITQVQRCCFCLSLTGPSSHLGHRRPPPPHLTSRGRRRCPFSEGSSPLTAVGAATCPRLGGRHLGAPALSCAPPRAAPCPAEAARSGEATAPQPAGLPLSAGPPAGGCRAAAEPAGPRTGRSPQLTCAPCPGAEPPGPAERPPPAP